MQLLGEDVYSSDCGAIHAVFVMKLGRRGAKRCEVPQCEKISGETTSLAKHRAKANIHRRRQNVVSKSNEEACIGRQKRLLVRYSRGEKLKMLKVV